MAARGCCHCLSPKPKRFDFTLNDFEFPTPPSPSQAEEDIEWGMPLTVALNSIHTVESGPTAFTMTGLEPVLTADQFKKSEVVDMALRKNGPSTG